jgi:hypothetical protein
LPGLRTEITEIATGLGALGHDLGSALADPPEQVVNVPDETWERLRQAYETGDHQGLFMTSWLNGRAFLLADQGLRGRIPVRVEWKGPDRQVESNPIPADLRIDHVFLVSIKNRSDVLANRSPAGLFRQEQAKGNWYLETAADEYQALYETALELTGAEGMPMSVEELSASLGKSLAALLPDRSWPEELQQRYLDLAHATATESARIWNMHNQTAGEREQLAWRLLRLAPAPYYLLGATATSSLRIRVNTPWDWRREWEFKMLELQPALSARQPQVDWWFQSRHRRTGEVRVTEGYVEIRWSHGKFSGVPEAKVQLRSRHEDVPGYTPLL